MDIMREIRQKILGEEFDYLLLLECLSAYKQPRDMITKLLKKEHIIRVKKGIYVFGKNYKKRPYSLEVLANLIYGPSYVSFEYALAYHGLIPEAVVRVTSASNKKSKQFSTQVGAFVYQQVQTKVFPLGINRISVDDEAHFLIASKEKALTDFLTRLKPFSNAEELFSYLVEGMRIDRESLLNLDLSLLKEIKVQTNHRNIDLLWDEIKK